MPLLNLLATAAQAATVAVWSGAGPNACLDACSFEWAVEQLTENERAELYKTMLHQENPQNISIHDGDVFAMMSYQIEGKPIATRKTTIAQLETTEPAKGWVMEGWSFVQIASCQNWAIVHHGNVATSENWTASDIPQPNEKYWPDIDWPTPSIYITSTPKTKTPEEGGTPPPEITETTVVPLLPSFWMSLTVLLVFLGFSRFRRIFHSKF
mgnify:CR=1 FL=1